MKWNVLPKADTSDLEAHGVDPVIAQLLINRGLSSKEEIDGFFTDTFLHDPKTLPNIDAAVDRILTAVKNKESIAIYGDYDVDGVSATSICFDYLYRALGADVIPYIPSRFDEGYGLGKTGLDYLVSKGKKVVITVDCGIRDDELVTEYSKKGIDFIITDHHGLPEEGNPPQKAVAVVHPGLPGSMYPYREICGAAVAWKLIVALDAEAEKQGLKKNDTAIEEYLPLVALATVCDIMPLQNENRAMVVQGLKRYAVTANKGIQALLKISEVDPHAIDAYHLGFALGPRINAGGRLEHALDGVRMFVSNNNDTAQRIAQKLDRLNKERQRQTKQMLDFAETQVEPTQKLLFVHEEDWPEGIVGLVAGKLCEKHNRPVLAASIKDGIVTGSARSISGFDITAAISKHSDILERFGGHHQAAGFTLKEENLESFKAGMLEYATNEITDEDLEKALTIDAEVSLADIDIEFIEKINTLSPFGMGNRKPLFVVRKVPVTLSKSIGSSGTHQKLMLENRIEALAFNASEDVQSLKEGATIDVVGSVSINEWNGRVTPQILIKDIKLHE